METIDYGAPFGFFLKDKGWLKKFAIASLLTCTLVGSLPVLGWTVAIARRVLKGEQDELPAWNEFGSLWKSGYIYWLVNLVWLLPVILSILAIYLPLIFAKSKETDLLLVSVFALLCCVLIFGILYTSAVLFLLPSMMGILAQTGSLGRAINPLNAWRVARPHLVPHLVVFLIVGVGLTTALSILAPLTLFLALPPMLVYTGMVLAHFAGQLSRLDKID